MREQVPERVAEDREAIGAADIRLLVDFGTSWRSLFESARTAKSAALGSPRNRASSDSTGTLNGGTGRGMTSGQSSGARGVPRVSTGAISKAAASRSVNGSPSCQRSRSVAMTDVLRYSWGTTVRSGIHAEMAIAGTRTPERSKVKSIWPTGADR